MTPEGANYVLNQYVCQELNGFLNRPAAKYYRGLSLPPPRIIDLQQALQQRLSPVFPFSSGAYITINKKGLETGVVLRGTRVNDSNTIVIAQFNKSNNHVTESKARVFLVDTEFKNLTGFIFTEDGPKNLKVNAVHKYTRPAANKYFTRRVMESLERGTFITEEIKEIEKDSPYTSDPPVEELMFRIEKAVRILNSGALVEDLNLLAAEESRKEV